MDEGVSLRVGVAEGGCAQSLLYKRYVRLAKNYNNVIKCILKTRGIYRSTITFN